MIYRIVDFKTGMPCEVSEDITLKKITLPDLKKTLASLNRGSILVDGKVKYAIACYLPSEAFIKMGRFISPTEIKELEPNQQQAFWEWYGQESHNFTIPVEILESVQI